MKEGQAHLRAYNQTPPLFQPASWRTKVDFIYHLTSSNNVLIAVLAESSGGKTSFCNLLNSYLHATVKPIMLLAKQGNSGKEVCQEIASQLGYTVTELSLLVKRINENRNHVVLIIDEAQNLPELFIEELMAEIKNQQQEAFFHVCLVADYSVISLLNNLAADQFNNLVHTIELGPLNESETRTYLVQRALATGLIQKPLTEGEYRQFYQFTKGNLAKINQHLESFVLKCALQKKNSKILKLKRVTTCLATVIILGAGYLSIHLSSNTSKQGMQQDLMQTSHIASWKEFSTLQLVDSAVPKREDRVTVEESHAIDKAVIIPHLIKGLSTDEDREMDGGTNSHPTYAKTKIQPSILVPWNLAYFKIDSHQKLTFSHQSSAHKYLIQLIAGHKMKDIKWLKNSNPLFAQAKIRHFVNSQGSWYILTLGEYSNRATALEEIKRLPHELSHLKPWVRPMEGLTNVA